MQNDLTEKMFSFGALFVTLQIELDYLCRDNCYEHFFFFSFAGDNGRIQYSITAGDDDHFEIAPNGTIFTRQMLDRETKGTYNLVVMARDCTKDFDKRLSSTVQVRIFTFSVFLSLGAVLSTGVVDNFFWQRIFLFLFFF